MPRILHLSDLHFRPGDPDDRDSSGRALLGTLADLQAEGAAPELILISGDVAMEGDAAAYAVAARFCERLREAAGGLPRERILCVPGNHDVARPLGRRLQRTLTSLEDAALFFSSANERALHRHKLGAYLDFAAVATGVSEEPLCQLSLGPLRVGVALLCTPWFSLGDDDKGQLWLGAAGAQAAAVGLSGCDLTIALLHHGPEWLHEAERPAALAALAGFDLICHGHLQSARPPDHEGTALERQLVLAAGSLHRRAQRPSRAFLIDVEKDADGQAVLRAIALCHRRGAERWDGEEALATRLGPTSAPRAFPLPLRQIGPPQRKEPRPSSPPPAPALERRDEDLAHLAALVAEAEASPAALSHPGRDQALRLAELYIELPVQLSEGTGLMGAHALLREPLVLLLGPPGAGKSATARHLCSEPARQHLAMPSEAADYDLGPGPLPVPLPLSLVEVLAARPRPADLLAACDTAVARRCPAVAPGFALRTLVGPTLLLVDGLEEAPAPRRAVLLSALRALLLEHPQARLLLCLRKSSRPLLLRTFSDAGPRLREATLVPLRLADRLRLIDRFVQLVSDIPFGMTIFGGAATLDAALRRAACGDGAAALGESPLLLTALCWVAARFGLPPQRAELFSHCLGALVENRLRPDPDAVGALIDEIGESNEALRSFRTAQALAERPDPWSAVRPQLDEPTSYEALRFLGGLLSRRSREVAERLLRAVLSEAGGRNEPGDRAQLIALSVQLDLAMVPYDPDDVAGRKARDELARLLGELEDRLQTTPLSTRVAIAEGLARTGDARLPLDLLDPGATAKALWVELPAGGGHSAVALLRYPLTSAQLWHLVQLSGYDPAPDAAGGRAPREQWRSRAMERPSHPAVLLSYDDALYLCRFLSQADWRYRYDLPTEGEWERAVRQGARDDRFYPWGGSMEPTYCNSGRRVGKTTPVGVFPAGTAAGGAGCADLIGNVWQWCQSEFDDDPTMMDVGEDGQLSLEVRPQAERVARGGSFAYLRTGAMRKGFPGTRSDEIGLRLARRSK